MGEHGATGADPETGEQGIQGTTGTLGTQGRTGTKGTKGTQGSQGAQGVQGSYKTQGAQGTTGTTGLSPQGKAGKAATSGAQGAQGTAGTEGTQGRAGTQGTRGTQGNAGYQGIQGTAGAQGAQGTIGSVGIQIQGATGEITSGWSGQNYWLTITGIQGAAGGGSGGGGSQGSQGPQGSQGSTGSGTQGSQGSTGSGTQGSQGVQGPTGGGGSTSLAGLTDTTINLPQEGQSLIYYNGSWQNIIGFDFDVKYGKITDITSTILVDNYVDGNGLPAPKRSITILQISDTSGVSDTLDIEYIGSLSDDYIYVINRTGNDLNVTFSKFMNPELAPTNVFVVLPDQITIENGKTAEIGILMTNIHNMAASGEILYDYDMFVSVTDRELTT